jgi:hypothetical protein
MAKKVLKAVDVTVETQKAKVTVQKKEKKVKVAVDTPKVDVEFTKEEDKKEFVLDTPKLDVKVTQEGDVVTSEVTASSGLLTKLGNLISKVFTKRFKK